MVLYISDGEEDSFFFYVLFIVQVSAITRASTRSSPHQKEFRVFDVMLLYDNRPGITIISILVDGLYVMFWFAVNK